MTEKQTQPSEERPRWPFDPIQPVPPGGETSQSDRDGRGSAPAPAHGPQGTAPHSSQRQEQR
jgi:hypothetical protein